MPEQLGVSPCGDETPLGLIPWPVKVQRVAGEFVLDSAAVIAAPSRLNNEAELLAHPLRCATGFPIPVVPPPSGEPRPGTILFRQANSRGDCGDEGYRLTVAPDLVTIDADTAAGHFHATRTLLQLLPPQAAAARRPKAGAMVRWVAPCVEISDCPRFGWRGFLLDEANSFLGMDSVRKCLDEMALLKMNVFHWLLTDDESWRLEIKRYPKLTSMGATSPGEGKGDVPAPRDSSQPQRYYYTQEEAREVIEYAARRHIRVVPTIEMPGHSGAALRTYPEWSAAGIFDVTSPAVVEALRNILDEVTALLPNAVVHTGGDEVMYWVWERAPSVQAAMAAKGLESSAPLQVEFSNAMAAYLAAKGGRMMVWADSLEQIPVETSVVLQYWQGDPAVLTSAASRGFDIVNSDRWHTYLDYDYAMLPLEKAYRFDPIPADLEARLHARILGTACPAWSIFMPTPARLDYMVFPRLAACAEVGWTAKENKDYASFLLRLKTQKLRWDVAGVRYARDRDRPSCELWKEVIAGAKVGTWTADQVNTGSVLERSDAHNHEMDITRFVVEKGRYLVAFVHVNGVDTLSVRAVEILEDGDPIAADWGGHVPIPFAPGDSGGSSYLFDLPVYAVKPGARYVLRANYYGVKGTDCSGDIYIRNVGDLPPDALRE